MLLQVDKVDTFHGRIQVLREIAFDIKEREITAIIGPNGAGKSTLMGTIAGIYKPAAGRISFRGEAIERLMPADIVSRGINLVPERRQVFDSLTVRENLILGAYHRYKADKRRLDQDIAEILEIFPPLQNMLKRYAGTLSGGEQQMVVIGRGLMSKPSLLLLDEPSLGLAPLIVQEIFSKLRQLSDEQGMTVLVVEQNARAAMKVADNLLIMERGAISYCGKPEELMQDEAVCSAYLGKGYQKKVGA
jgi:branched-chain amino acid transport system ATP-binding protein